MLMLPVWTKTEAEDSPRILLYSSFGFFCHVFSQLDLVTYTRLGLSSTAVNQIERKLVIALFFTEVCFYSRSEISTNLRLCGNT